MNREITNEKIISTKLGFEMGSIFSYMIFVGIEDTHQGFGGYALGGEYTDKTIKGILETVGVESWEDLAGQYVRVEREKFGKIYKIGNIIKDIWFDPSNL